jgi:hypothetical protein
MSRTRHPGSIIGDDSDGLNGPFADDADLSFIVAHPSPPQFPLPGIDPTIPPVSPHASPPAFSFSSDGADIEMTAGSSLGNWSSLGQPVVVVTLIQDVVFIDSRVPDIQDLLNGLKPGEKAFVIDGSSNGLDQAASILKSENLGNLTGIQIVSHGAAGEIELGATMLNDSDLPGHAAALASIGSALAKGGALSLYACDTAQGAMGQQFIADLSHLAGVDVAAATHNVGSAEKGGSWTLDASTSAAAAPASVPFTEQALTNFQGTLNQNFVFVPSGGSATTGFGNTGSAGNATLAAAITFNAHETLIGGPGDTLNAASFGQDTFVFANNFGHNTINNFHPALDAIQLQQSQFGSLAAVLADLHQVGADSVLSLDPNHVITVSNTAVASLTAAHFHLA